MIVLPSKEDNLKPTSGALLDSEQRSDLIRDLIPVVLATPLALTAFEVVEHLFFPTLDFWTAHFITISFSSAVAVIAAYILLKRRQAQVARLRAEIAERERAEQELTQARRELESRVAERTAELVKVNAELRESQEHSIAEKLRSVQLLEQRVAERTAELSTLLEVSQNVASTLELKPLLTLVLDQLQVLVDYCGAAVIAREGERLEILHYNQWLDPGQVTPLFERMNEAGLHHRLFESRTPIIVHDVNEDSFAARAFREFAGEQLKGPLAYIHSWMAIPLIVKERVIGLLVLTHDQTGYYTEHRAQLALAVANQAAVAIENARLYESARRLAVMEERQRLARDLHDSISQALYGIELGSQTAKELLGSDNPFQLAEPIDYVQSLAKAALAEMRALIFDLRPEALATEGLVAGLGKQITSLRVRHRLSVEAELISEPDASLQTKEALYRIAQESFHNIVKHSRARNVKVSLGQVDGTLQLMVRDDGVGFDPTRAYPGHLGLRSMRERALRQGGKFQIDSTPSGGTTVCATLPARSSG